MSEPSPLNSGKQQVLTALLSGDNSMKLLTIILVVLSGGTNFFTTKQSTDNLSTRIDGDIQRAVSEVHTMFNHLDDFQNRQKDIINSLKEVTQSNNDQLKIQRTLLENNEAFLKKNDQEMGRLAEILKKLNDERDRKNLPPDNF